MKSLDVINFYIDKKEHYPISDEFIEYYQQKNGGYITYANETGHPIHPAIHEPNQKWHLLESYYICKVKEKGTLEFNITGFNCPELLLWMAEAADVDEAIIKEAANYAKEKIDEIRRTSPTSAYSAKSVIHMNNKFKEKYQKNLWGFIVEKIS